MKKLILIALIITGFQTISKAQVDIQLNPIAILFEVVQLSAEFPVGSNGGIEIDLVGGEGEFGLIGMGKYYMNPKLGADRFFIGGFAGALFSEGAGIGFIAGYKWVAVKGVNFELSFGVGRGTGDIEVFPYGKLAVGYRFGGEKTD